MNQNFEIPILLVEYQSSNSEELNQFSVELDIVLAKNLMNLRE